jgi:hypothetical protein
MSRDERWNRAAILEWTISLVYIFYVWSFFIDFLPAVKTKDLEQRYPAPEAKLRRQDDEHPVMTEMNGNMMGGPVYSSGGGEPAGAPVYNASYDGYRVQQGTPATTSRNF